MSLLKPFGLGSFALRYTIPLLRSIQVVNGRIVSTYVPCPNTKSIRHLSSLPAEAYRGVYTREELQKVEEKEKEPWWKENDWERRNKPFDNWKGLPVIYLKNKTNGGEVYLVGTNHVSKKSANLVKDVIRAVRPNYVMVEMNKDAYNYFYMRSIMKMPMPFPFTSYTSAVEYFNTFDRNNFARRICYLLNFFHLYGREFEVAIKEGQNVEALIVLGDERRTQESSEIFFAHISQIIGNFVDGFKNTFGCLTKWETMMVTLILTKLLVSKVYKEWGKSTLNNIVDMEDLRNEDNRKQDSYPKFYKHIVSDRNEGLYNSLCNLKGTTVGVVGRGHLIGIHDLWHKPNN